MAGRLVLALRAPRRVRTHLYRAADASSRVRIPASTSATPCPFRPFPSPRSRLAAARGPHLHILPLLPRGDDSKALSPPPHAQRGRPASPAVPSSPEPVKLWCPASSSSPVTCPEDITAMTWLAFVRPSGTAVSSGQTQVQQQGRSLRPTGAGAAAGPGAGTAHGVAGEAGDAGEGYSPPRRRGGSLGSSGGSGQWGQWAAGGGSRSSSGRGGAGGVFHGVQVRGESARVEGGLECLNSACRSDQCIIRPTRVYTAGLRV